MSDVIWTAAIIILFIAGFACAAYSGWQIFCPMRLRRIHVIYLTSQKLRVEGEKCFWHASFVASILECTGVAPCAGESPHGYCKRSGSRHRRHCGCCRLRRRFLLRLYGGNRAKRGDRGSGLRSPPGA